MILVLVIVGVFAYRSLVNPTEQTNDDLSARRQEIRSLWSRVDGYPGAGTIEAEEVTGSDYIVSERHYGSPAGYPDAIAFYDRHLPTIGWEKVGEQMDWPGYTSPIRIYRHRDYHLLLHTTKTGIALRITWSADQDPKVDLRLIPD